MEKLEIYKYTLIILKNTFLQTDSVNACFIEANLR